MSYSVNVSKKMECLSKSEILSWSVQSPVNCLRKPDERHRCVQEHRMEAECTERPSRGDRYGEDPLPHPSRTVTAHHASGVYLGEGVAMCFHVPVSTCHSVSQGTQGWHRSASVAMLGAMVFQCQVFLPSHHGLLGRNYFTGSFQDNSRETFNNSKFNSTD